MTTFLTIVTIWIALNVAFLARRLWVTRHRWMYVENKGEQK